MREGERAMGESEGGKEEGESEGESECRIGGRERAMGEGESERVREGERLVREGH